MVILILLPVALILFVGLWALVQYNGFIRLRNLVQESWRQVDVELHRRHELIPNLVETVKGYAAHERAVFDAVTQARALAVAPGSRPGQQAAQEDMLTQAVGRLFAVAEAYPELRANQGFLHLQAELVNTENRIAAGRRFYNSNVRALNTKVESFPSSIIAGMARIGRAEYFEADPGSRGVPGVQFGAAEGLPPLSPGSQAPMPPLGPGPR